MYKYIKTLKLCLSFCFMQFYAFLLGVSCCASIVRFHTVLSLATALHLHPSSEISSSSFPISFSANYLADNFIIGIKSIRIDSLIFNSCVFSLVIDKLPELSSETVLPIDVEKANTSSRTLFQQFLSR